MIPNLYFLDTKKFDVLPTVERKEYLKMQKTLAIPDGHPFFIGSKSDDYYFDEPLNEFCEYLIAPKRPSRNTWKQYAYYAFEFIDFLNALGCHWLNATEAHIEYYYRTKTDLAQNPNLRKVTARTWNLIAGAIRHLYEYAVKKKFLVAPPFSYDESHSGYRHGKHTTTTLRTPAVPAPIRILDIDNYKNYWRPLLAKQRNAQRNINLIELLLCSGFRISEALGLHTYNIPDPHSQKYANRSVVPISIIGKRNKERVVPIPKFIISNLRFYIEEERAESLSRHEKAKHTKSTETRLFLTEFGPPLSNRTVQKLFLDISTATGLKLEPHGCRHIYAAFVLDFLIRQARAMDRETGRTGADSYENLLGDPLQILQRLLGHANLETVFIYLDLIPDVRLIVENAVSNFVPFFVA